MKKEIICLITLCLSISLSTQILAKEQIVVCPPLKEQIVVCPPLKDLIFNLRDPQVGQIEACEHLSPSTASCYSSADYFARYKGEPWFIGSATYAISSLAAKNAILTAINKAKASSPIAHDNVCTYLVDNTVEINYFKFMAKTNPLK